MIGHHSRCGRGVPVALLPAVLLALTIVGCAPDREPVRQIVLITIDTLRASSTTPYGSQRDTTPNLVAFAEKATQFNRAYTTMPTTGPAHISMLTGLYPQQHGSLQNGVPARRGLPSTASVLAEKGFRNAAFVSVQHLSRAVVGLDGFEVWEAPWEVRDGAETVDMALQWAAAHRDERMFLWVHLFDPHSPYQIHDNSPADIAELLVPLESTPVSDYYSFLHEPMPEDEARKNRLLYEADIFYADRQVGRLLDGLEELGIGAAALTVITSDHGEVLDEVLDTHNYGFDHGEFLLPGELQVPLWIRAPDLAPGSSEDRVVEIRALYGSMLWTAGIGLDASVPRLPGLGGSDDPEQAFAYVSRRHFRGEPVPQIPEGERFGVVTTEHLGLWQDGAVVTKELYDLTTDPLGVENIAADQSQAAGGLEQLARGWWVTHAADLNPQTQTMSDEVREQLRSLGYVQ